MGGIKMKFILFIFTMIISSCSMGYQSQGIFQNPYSDSYFIKPSQTLLNADVKLKKLPGFEVKIDSLHKGTDLSQSQKHDLKMGYNIKSPIGVVNLSANNTKMPGYVTDKKSLSASYVFKNNWSNFSLSYENNNYLDAKTNKFSDPTFKVSGSFIF